MLTPIRTEQDEDTVVETFECDEVVECDGSSIWSDTFGLSLRVTGITVRREPDGLKCITVQHDGPWEIYTDRGFEAAISRLLGYDVSFTEQGMQEDGYASME